MKRVASFANSVEPRDSSPSGSLNWVRADTIELESESLQGPSASPYCERAQGTRADTPPSIRRTVARAFRAGITDSPVTPCSRSKALSTTVTSLPGFSS